MKINHKKVLNKFFTYYFLFLNISRSTIGDYQESLNIVIRELLQILMKSILIPFNLHSLSGEFLKQLFFTRGG